MVLNIRYVLRLGNLFMSLISFSHSDINVRSREFTHSSLNVVFWGQLTHTGDPGSEAHISQILQVYENFLYQRIVIHSMQTLVITQSLFMTYNTRREHTTFTQCYEIACIWFNSQYPACVPQEYFVHRLRCTDVHTPDITSLYQHRFYKWLEKIYHDFDWQSSNVLQSFKHGKYCLSRFIAQILVVCTKYILVTPFYTIH